MCVWGGRGRHWTKWHSPASVVQAYVQSWISVSDVYWFQSPSVLKRSHSDLLKEVSLGEGILAKTHGFLCFLITSCTGPSGTDFIIFQASKCTSPTKGFPLIARISSPASIVPACSAAPPARTNAEETVSTCILKTRHLRVNIITMEHICPHINKPTTGKGKITHLLKRSIQTIKNHTSPFCYQDTTIMGHMQDPGKGSALLQCVSTWLKLMSNYMKEQIYELAKKGHKLVWSWRTHDVAQTLKSKRLAFVLLKVICPLIKKGVVLGGGGTHL